MFFFKVKTNPPLNSNNIFDKKMKNEEIDRLEKYQDYVHDLKTMNDMDEPYLFILRSPQ